MRIIEDYEGSLRVIKGYYGLLRLHSPRSNEYGLRRIVSHPFWSHALLSYWNRIYVVRVWKAGLMYRVQGKLHEAVNYMLFLFLLVVLVVLVVTPAITSSMEDEPRVC